MRNKRIVVTGVGAVTSVGNTAAETWGNLLNGNTGIGPITRFQEQDFPSRIAGEVKRFEVSQFVSRKDARRLDPFCHYSIASAEEAVDQANIDFESEDRTRVGVMIASGIGGICTLEEQLRRFIKSGPTKVSPFLVPMMIGNMASGAVAIHFKLQGPNFGIVSACSAGSHAIGEAYWLLKRGDADIILAGGTEASITPICFAGFSALKALSKRNHEPELASRPFDAERDGFVLAEGAGTLVLETLEHAQSRKVPILAEIVGYSATGDGYHITSPPPDSHGAVAAIKLSLNHAGLTANDIDYINAHGTGTVLNDKCETLALKTALGKKAYQIPISSTKSLTGHALGAAGAIESIVCIKAIAENSIPGTYNYTCKDPDCDLDYVPNESRQKEVNVALNLNFGFGGHNAVIVFKKYEN